MTEPHDISAERLEALIAEHVRAGQLYCAMNGVKSPPPERMDTLTALRQLQSLRDEGVKHRRTERCPHGVHHDNRCERCD
jgi:hypothetical protein